MAPNVTPAMVQQQRKVIRREWEAFCVARLEYLRANLKFQEMRASPEGCERYQVQIDSLLRSMEHHQHPAMRSQCEAPHGRNAPASCLTVKAADAAAE